MHAAHAVGNSNEEGHFLACFALGGSMTETIFSWDFQVSHICSSSVFALNLPPKSDILQPGNKMQSTILQSHLLGCM
jgi:hypothetical protein